MTLQDVLALVGLFALTLGPLGSAVEALGVAFAWPKVIAIGQRLEALGHDVPKLIRGSRFRDQVLPPSSTPKPPFLPLWCCVLCLGLFSVFFLPACGATSPCSETSLGLITAECKLKVDRECAGFVDEELCPAVKECDARVDAWRDCQ